MSLPFEADIKGEHDSRRFASIGRYAVEKGALEQVERSGLGINALHLILIMVFFLEPEAGSSDPLREFTCNEVNSSQVERVRVVSVRFLISLMIRYIVSPAGGQIRGALSVLILKFVHIGFQAASYQTFQVPEYRVIQLKQVYLRAGCKVLWFPHGRVKDLKVVRELFSDAYVQFPIEKFRGEGFKLQQVVAAKLVC